MLVFLCKPQTPHTSVSFLTRPSDSQCSCLLSCLCKQNHCAGFSIFFFYFVLVSADAITCKNINVTAFPDVNSNWDQAI